MLAKKRKNFIDELYPVGSLHLLPHPISRQPETAEVTGFVCDTVREVTLGVKVRFWDSRERHFNWIELNNIRSGINSPTLSEVQVS